MPRLVHLNGPPGIGKSTLALRFIDDYPLAFCLDIDSFRRRLGRWDENTKESGRLARRMALRMAEEHLSNGLDVIVPQFVARPEFVDELRATALGAGASFHEIVLLDSAIAAEARFETRAADPVWADHHAEAARMIAGSGGFAAMYDALVAVLDRLPDAVQIMTATGDVDGAYRSLLEVIE